MTAINHALTGAIIGINVANPWAAVVLSFLSHFVCDAIPHFGHGNNNAAWIRSRQFRRLLMVDALLCVLLVSLLFAAQSPNWLLASICAFVATSPDLLWINKFKQAQRQGEGDNESREHWFLRFATRIQWFEKPLGGLVEIFWFAGASILLTLMAA